MQWFYDLKIGTKLVSSFLLVAAIAAVIGIVGIVNINEIDEADTMLYEYMTVPISEVGEISTLFQRARSNVLEIITMDDPKEMKEVAGKVNQRLAAIDKLMDQFEKTIQTDKLRESFETFKKGNVGYNALLNRMMDLSIEGKNSAALALWFGDADKQRKVVQSALESMVEYKVTRAKEIAEGNTALANHASTVALVVMAAGIVIAVVLGFFIARIIANPVKTLASQAEVIASGDLTVEVQQSGKDEIGMLSGSFKLMVDSLRDTIGKVGEASAAVASASSQISSSTEEMAAGAQEQTSQAGEVASAVEEMTKTIIENSKNASSTADTAKQAKDSAGQGGQVVEETVAGMKRIAEVVNKSAETVKALGKSSDQIGEIIGVIDDIADQTNLLALNAAIEAARAGEQGRGFAVVADEVRKLAERTTKATKEIAGMIKAIQADTTGAVASMNEGTKQVDEGIKLADKAGESLRDIVEVSQKVTDMVAQIAAASEEQSSASEQISKNVEAISSVTGETAQGVQQIARAAEDLNRLTQNLQDLVGRFKLSGDGHSHNISVTSSKSSKKFNVPKSGIAVRDNGALVSHE